MNLNIWRAFGALGLGLLSSAALAQTSTNQVASNTDWSVFVEDSPKECWGVSAPKESVNTRDGQTVAVRRGDVLLFVFYRPGAAVQGQVAFTGPPPPKMTPRLLPP